MARFANTDIYVEVDGHDLSSWAFSVDTPSERERLDASGFNSTGAKTFLAGAKEDSVTVQFRQDFASGGPHDVLSDIYQNQSTVTLEIRPTSGAVSSTNPALQGNVQLLSYNGLSGDLNSVSEFSVTFTPADASGIVWSST